MVIRTYMMLALWLGCLLQIQSAAVSASEAAIALCPDRIIDGVSDQPLLGQTVVIDGEKIVAAVPEAKWLAIRLAIFRCLRFQSL